MCIVSKMFALEIEPLLIIRHLLAKKLCLNCLRDFLDQNATMVGKCEPDVPRC